MTIIDESTKSRYYPDSFNWWELPETCKRCSQPLHMASGQNVSFCPNCVIDARNARNGRRLLALVKERHLQKCLESGDYGGGAFASGMPL